VTLEFKDFQGPFQSLFNDLFTYARSQRHFSTMLVTCSHFYMQQNPYPYLNRKHNNVTRIHSRPNMAKSSTDFQSIKIFLNNKYSRTFQRLSKPWICTFWIQVLSRTRGYPDNQLGPSTDPEIVHGDDEGMGAEPSAWSRGKSPGGRFGGKVPHPNA